MNLNLYCLKCLYKCVSSLVSKTPLLESEFLNRRLKNQKGPLVEKNSKKTMSKNPK